MILERKFLSILVILLACFVSFTPLNGQTIKKEKTSSANQKDIKQKKTQNTIELATGNGNSVTLPKINPKTAEQEFIFPSYDEVFADAGIPSKSLEALQKHLIEEEEMRELSGKLGISINDPSLLDLYREVADWLGTKYRRGGMSRKAVDCSGFTGLIYKAVYGETLDRVSTAIAKNLKNPVSKEDLLPGDMVFFSTFNKKYINHVGIYLGEGKFIHASIKKGVIVSSLDEGYYSKAWRKGGRN